MAKSVARQNRGKEAAKVTTRKVATTRKGRGPKVASVLGARWGAELMARRDKLKLSQATLAKKLSVSQATLSNYEGGRTIPRRAIAMRLAAFLKGK